MLTIYIGSTFRLGGSLQKDGAPADFTGYTLTAKLFDVAGNTMIAALNVIWLDQTNGLITLSSPSTATWPPGKARIDCKLVTPMGEVILGPPIYLRIAQSPLS